MSKKKFPDVLGRVSARTSEPRREAAGVPLVKGAGGRPRIYDVKPEKLTILLTADQLATVRAYVADLDAEERRRVAPGSGTRRTFSPGRVLFEALQESRAFREWSEGADRERDERMGR